MSDKTTDDRTGFTDWPDACVGDLIDRNKYQYIHDNGAGIPELRLDDLVPGRVSSLMRSRAMSRAPNCSSSKAPRTYSASIIRSSGYRFTRT
jgi:hypothetical protein